MHVLKKAQGIDLKAKNTALHGNVKLQFRDGVTDKIVDEVEHKNFFTSALNQMFNQCPWGLNNTSLMGKGAIADTNTPTSLGNIYDIPLGGIMLFPQSLGEDVDDIFPNWETNQPVAYASRAEYTVSNSKQGTFNGVESAMLSNGYRYVYDWSTSNGNGQIASVALSHKNCYNYFEDGINILFPKHSSTSADTGRGYFGVPSIGNAEFNGVIAECDEGMLYVDRDASYSKVRFYNIRPYDIQLLGNTSGIVTADEALWSNTFSFQGYPNPSYVFEGGYLWAIFRNAGANQTAKILKISKDTGEVLETTEVRWNYDLCSANYSYGLKNGYVYAGSRSAGKIFKCSITDANDVTEIPCDAVANESISTTENSDIIFGYSFMIKDGVLTNYKTKCPNLSISNHITYLKGLWVVSNNRVYRDKSFSAQILTPYCATKCNLDEVKTKTADRTMKVIYTVTQV